MPAPIIKYTNFFQGLGQGWAESLYYQALNEDLSQALDFVDPISTARAGVLAAGYSIQEVRVALVQDGTGVPTKRIVRLSEVSKVGVTTWAPAAPNLRCMLQWLTSDNKHSKKLFLGGIPAGLGDNGKVPDQDYATWRTRFNSLVAKWQNAGMGWFGTSVAQTAVVNTWVQDAPTGRWVFTLQTPGMTWPVGPGFPTSVKIALPGKTPLDGNQVVVVSTATSCFTKDPIGAAPQSTGQIGTMQRLGRVLYTLAPAVPNQQPPGSVFAQRIVTHKTGRPTYASRGRLSARPRW